MPRKNFDVHWGAETLEERGPIIPLRKGRKSGNAIGEQGGLWGTHQLAARAAGIIPENHKPNLDGYSPEITVPPNPAWSRPLSIVSIDPWGQRAHEVGGFPSIVMTNGQYHNWWIHRLMEQGKMEPDGKILHRNGNYNVTEIAADQVWHLPGIAKRLGVSERKMRRVLSERYHQLNERLDVQILLPAMAWIRGHVFGDIQHLFAEGCRQVPVTARIHDYCGDGDLGSTRCTCEAYRNLAVKKCIQAAQKGGVGVIIEQGYEGCGAGPVPKHIIYRMREQHPDGDTDDHYYAVRMKVVGAADPRLHQLYPDMLLYLGIDHIDRWVSMSRDKMNALVAAGISVRRQVPLPKKLVHAKARVEYSAKINHGGYLDPRQRGVRSQNGFHTN